MTGRPLSFGVNVNTRVPIIYPERYSPGDLVDLAAAVEHQGYDAVWVGDNFFAKSRLESITTLAAVATRTSRVALGTAAFILPLRHTVWVAISWATLDQLCGGRTILNVCVGGGGKKLGGPQFAAEFEVAGVPYNRRGEVMEEQIGLLRELWSGTGNPFEGKFHQLPSMEIAPLPVQQPAPPIWITNNPQLIEGISEKLVDRMQRRVARLADGWMTALATPAEFAGQWRRIVAHAKDLGRDPTQIIPAYQMTLCLADSRDAAEGEARAYLNRYYGTSYQSLADTIWGRDPYGTADDCFRAIKRLRDQGARSFALRFAARDQAEQVERFSQQVLPRLRDLE